MNSKTNQKINQVSEKTLVIGIDIAKRTHYACAVDDRGCVLQKSFLSRKNIHPTDGIGRKQSLLSASTPDQPSSSRIECHNLNALITFFVRRSVDRLKKR